ncbi:MAG: hypothetical protein RQM92_06530 [Candidatus Syntrophopropionicum ammoniitolerans]
MALVDLDLINPYFRVRQVKNDFAEKGIAVISPPGKLAGLPIFRRCRQPSTVF